MGDKAKSAALFDGALDLNGPVKSVKEIEAEAERFRERNRAIVGMCVVVALLVWNVFDPAPAYLGLRPFSAVVMLSACINRTKRKADEDKRSQNWTC